MEATHLNRILKKMAGPFPDKAFRQLFTLCYDRFFRISYYYLQNDEWAQEVTLDIFYKLWEKREELFLLDHFNDYAFVLLKNASLNYLAKETRYSKVDLREITEYHFAEINPEEDLMEEELLKIYLNALDELPDRCREVYLMIREEKLSYKEVAGKLDISPKTVDAQLQKAVSRLKKRIKEYFSSAE